MSTLCSRGMVYGVWDIQAMDTSTLLLTLADFDAYENRFPSCYTLYKCWDDPKNRVLTAHTHSQTLKKKQITHLSIVYCLVPIHW